MSDIGYNKIENIKHFNMKLMNKSLLLLSAVSFIIVGCRAWSHKLDYEKTFTLQGEINVLDLSGGADIIVDSTLARDQIRVLANSPDLSTLVIKEESGKLIVKNRFGFGSKLYKIFIPEFNYESISVSGGVDLVWNTCNVDALTITASGGSDCLVKGITDRLEVIASGGADVDLKGLIATDVTVTASGGSDVESHAAKTLSVCASGGADVEIYGNPQIIDWSISGGADIDLNK